MTSAQERKAARQAQRISRSRSEVPATPRAGGRLDVQGGGDLAARDDSSLFEDALDIGFAPIRGVANAAQDIYGLADTLLLDSLPDSSDPWLGESKTQAGALVAGASNFLTGFIPVVGWIGKGAKVGKSIQLARGLSKGAEATALVKHGKLASTGVRAARDAVAGAITDVAVWDGHEERLSDLIQNFPMLQNPVTEFLASDEDDSEIVGRLKTVVEGAGAGLVFDGLLMGLKQLREMRRGVRAGLSPEEAIKKAEEAVSNESIAQANKAAEDAARLGEVDDLGRQVDEAGEAVPPRDPEEPTVPRDPEEPTRTLETEGPAPTKPGTSAHEIRIAKALGLDEAQAKEIADAVEGRLSLNQAEGLADNVNPRDLSAAERLELGLRRSDINLRFWDGPEESWAMIRTVDELFQSAAQRDAAGTGARTMDDLDLDTLEALADVVGESNTNKMLQATADDIKNMREINARTRARMWVLQTKANELVESMRRTMDGDLLLRDQDKALLQANEEIKHLAMLQNQMRGLQGEQGRGLVGNQLRVPVRDMEELGLIAKSVEESGGRVALQETMEQLQRLFGDGGRKGLNRLAAGARGLHGTKAGRMLNEYWMFSLLSGGRTISVNAISGLMMSIYRPLEGMLGAVVRGGLKAATGNLTEAALASQDFRRLGLNLMGLASSFGDSMKFMAESWRTGDAILDPMARTMDNARLYEPQVTAANAGFKDDTLWGAGVNFLGNLIRLPTRILGATDEAAKQLNYRANFWAELTNQGMSKGQSFAEASSKAHDTMANSVFNGQRYGSRSIYEEGLRRAPKNASEEEAKMFARSFTKARWSKNLSTLSEKALAVSREVTFTTPLDPRGIQSKIQSIVVQHPTLRLILPFVRTPANLLNTAAQRLDIPSVVRGLGDTVFPGKFGALEQSRMKYLADFASGDSMRMTQATGRLSAGIGAVAFFSSLAANGKLTGRGPSDPEQRALLEDAGWLPYSIRVETDEGVKYVQYARFDPFAALVGTAADIVDYARFSAEEDQGENEKLAIGLMVGFANNFTNKTYLTGLSRFVEVLQQPDNKMEGFARSFIGSLVPTALSQGTPALSGDDVARDLNEMLDAARSRIPGLSDKLGPIRNILGEPVKKARSVFGEQTYGMADFFLPVAFRTVKDDLIADELAVLGHGFSPPKKYRLGLNLTDIRKESGQTAYDRWSQLHGEVKIGGKTLRTRMRELIRSKRYQRMSAEGTYELESPRISEIQRLLQRYRQRAWDQMVSEFPEIGQHEQTRTLNQRRLKVGQFPVKG